MADTSYILKFVEPRMRDWVAQKIGTPLYKRKIAVGKNSDNREVRFEFDGVSEDGRVGVCISASSSYKPGQMRKFFMEATLLNRVHQFNRRIMVFIDQRMWDSFKNQCDGMIDLKNIEPMICNELPTDMRAKIGEIYKKSAAEVGDKSGPGMRIPGKRK